MGMDVFGSRPTSEAGKYFRASVWGWRPLWDYCVKVAPKIAGKVKYGHSNDGHGLGGADSKALAVLLQEELRSGRTGALVAKTDAELAALPDDPCRICAGTGRRLRVPECGAGDLPCNGCSSSGNVRPAADSYHLDVDRVRRFAVFLEDCGGFKIC